MNLDCALLELEMLGIKLDPNLIRKLRENEEGMLRNRRKKKEKMAEAMRESSFESDETFYFIVGYTDGGFPYGITWEEADLADLEKDITHTNRKQWLA